MKLILYLKAKGRCTGPRGKNTSHSGMQNSLTVLMGLPLFEGGEIFLHFGTALHSKFAEEAAADHKALLPADMLKIRTMSGKLSSHVVVKRLTQDSIREQKRYTSLNGVEISYILDVLQPKTKTGSDLKTTTCATLEEIIASCRKYGYFRQAVTYKKAENLKKFYFIFINKTAPYKITIIDVDDYPEDMAYAEQELKFTLYIEKFYGKLIATKKDIDTGTKPEEDKKEKRTVANRLRKAA